MIRELFFYLVFIISVINLYLMYYLKFGFAFGLPGNSEFFLTFVILLFLFVFMTISTLSIERSTKKNMLRLSFFISLILLFIPSLYSRAIDIQESQYIWRWFQTILYAFVVLSVISLASKLFNKLKKISSNDGDSY